MKRIIIASAIVFSGGCGSSAPPVSETTPVEEVAEGPTEEELRAAREERARQDAELRRLRGQLAMARAEAEIARIPPGLSETVRIGGGDGDHDDLFGDDPGFQVEEESQVAAASAPSRPAAHAGPRPVLRLHGQPAGELRGIPDAAPLGASPGVSTAPPVIVPAPPPGVSMQLPTTTAGVASIPGAPALSPTMPVAAAPTAAAADPAVAEYRAALRLVRDRRPDEALRALSRFVDTHPGHPYTDDALYWQGEVLYMQRQYRRAVERYEVVVARHADGDKAADALLKLGLCFRRMGESARANGYFERLRNQYPNSVAARMASREDAS